MRSHTTSLAALLHNALQNHSSQVISSSQVSKLQQKCLTNPFESNSLHGNAVFAAGASQSVVSAASAGINFLNHQYKHQQIPATAKAMVSGVPARKVVVGSLHVSLLTRQLFTLGLMYNIVVPARASLLHTRIQYL